MKKAALILTSIFSALTVVSYAIPTFIYFSNASTIVFGVFYFAMLILAGVFGLIAINSISKNKKAVWIGVCDIIFCGVVGGIFYLIWNPNSEDPTAAVAKNEASSRIIENQIAEKEAPAPKESAAEELLKLKDLKDMGAITDEEYQEKRKNLIDKL